VLLEEELEELELLEELLELLLEEELAELREVFGEAFWFFLLF
jgi:hypothetical protein